MKKLVLTIASALTIVGVMLCGCRETDNDQSLGHMDGPKITIKTIWLDDTPFQPADTIVIDEAGRVKIDYIVESEGDLLLVNEYYVSGGTGSLLPTSMSRDSLVRHDALYRYEGQLQCSGFLPFRCAFRIVAANRYGGTDAKGFYLMLPATSLTGYPATPAIYTHSGRNFGPGQSAGNSPSNGAGLGQTFNNVKLNGRYTQWDIAYQSSEANSLDRAGSHDFGFNYVRVVENGEEVRKMVLFSPSAFNDVYPAEMTPINMLTGAPIAITPDVTFGYTGLDYSIRYYPGVTHSDLTVTKFYQLDLFTSSMWDQLTSIPRLDALASSFKDLCQDEVVYPESTGYWFFHAKSPLYEWYGVLWLRNLSQSNSGGIPTAAQFDVKTFQYW